MCIRDRLYGLNSSGPAPKNISILKLKTMGLEKIPPYGPLPVTVPGAVAGWTTLHNKFGKFNFDECVQRYIKSVNAGLLKIMSKMGISVLSSYRGGCNFETVGLSRTIVNDYFPGVVSKISGIGLVGIEKKIRQIHKEAFESTETV